MAGVCAAPPFTLKGYEASVGGIAADGCPVMAGAATQIERTPDNNSVRRMPPTGRKETNDERRET